MQKVGVGFIDDEHDQLQAMLDKLRANSASMVDHATAVGLFTKLDGFIRAHFQEEENFLAKLDASGVELKRHQEAHGAILARAEKLLGDINLTNLEIAAQLAELLEYWMNEHIAKFDLKIPDLMVQARQNAGLPLSPTRQGRAQPLR